MSVTSRNSWTEEDLKRLDALIAKGVPTGDIAAALNRTVNAVTARADRNGLKFAPGQRSPREKTRRRQSSAFGRLFESV